MALRGCSCAGCGLTRVCVTWSSQRQGEATERVSPYVGRPSRELHSQATISPMSVPEPVLPPPARRRGGRESKASKVARLTQILDRLTERFPDPQTALTHDS